MMADDRRPGRPPKPATERLVPVTINLRPGDYAAACTLARGTREPVAVLLRKAALKSLPREHYRVDSEQSL